MKYELSISGMSCGHCVRAVEEALKALDGVAVQSVAIGSAVVEAPDDEVVRSRMREAIDEEGYEVTGLN
jgi:copper chaperone CopZ